MRTAGFLRWRLANSLRSAYALGLLTHDTFDHRIDDLYGRRLLDPRQLIGDLTFRPRARTQRRHRVLLDSFLAWQRGEDLGQTQLPILALDWTGATPELLIGRSSSCDLVLHHPTVSRRHAQLFFREGRWIVIDLSSTNGTHINGQQVRRSELRPGDMVALGGERLRVD